MSSSVQQGVPHHVAIIMDGNGRWATARGLPRPAGHKAGVDAVRRTLEAAKDLGIKIITLFAFSTENWRRPQDEVESLMGLLRFYLKSELSRLHQEGVRLRVLGDVTAMAADIQTMINQAEKLTAENTAFTLCIALNYGSQLEITRAAQRLALQVQQGTLQPQEITPAHLEGELYTAGIPNPDLLIRTSGEQRISNFLLWQCAYAEFYFSPLYWPDFDKDELGKALASFAARERRYGAAPATTPAAAATSAVSSSQQGS